MVNNIGFHIAHTNKRMEDNILEFWRTNPTLKGVKVFQIFVAEPSGYHMYFRTEEERKTFKRFVKNKGLTIYVHGRYLDAPWNTDNKSLFTYIRKELERCIEIGACGFIIHLYTATWNQVLNGLKKINPPKGIKIFLENSAMKPRSTLTYSQASELMTLYKKVSPKYDIGICIDTAHLWTTGVDVGNPKIMKKMLEGLPKKDILIHLNDSSTDLGSGVDRHATLGQGKIWGIGKSTESLKILLQKKYDTILERDHDVSDDYMFINRIIRGGIHIPSYIKKMNSVYE